MPHERIPAVIGGASPVQSRHFPRELGRDLRDRALAQPDADRPGSRFSTSTGSPSRPYIRTTGTSSRHDPSRSFCAIVSRILALRADARSRRVTERVADDDRLAVELGGDHECLVLGSHQLPVRFIEVRLGRELGHHRIRQGNLASPLQSHVAPRRPRSAARPG